MPSIISRASRTIETAFLKYGMINFTLTLYLLPFGVTDKKSVLALEQYFIDTLNPEYNYCIYSFWESIQGKLDSYYSLILNINPFFIPRRWMPALIGGFSNFIMPLLIGSIDMATQVPSPKLSQSYSGTKGGVRPYLQTKLLHSSEGKRVPQNEEQLGYYLAGLWDGDIFFFLFRYS